jgi:hypothetical protein
MPRAIAAFHKQGFAVDPWPIYYLDAYQPRPMSVAAHEWLGLACYWVLGRMSIFLPSSILEARNLGASPANDRNQCPRVTHAVGCCHAAAT